MRGGIFDVESGLIYKMFKMCDDIFDTSNYLAAHACEIDNCKDFS